MRTVRKFGRRRRQCIPLAFLQHLQNLLVHIFFMICHAMCHILCQYVVQEVICKFHRERKKHFHSNSISICSVSQPNCVPTRRTVPYVAELTNAANSRTTTPSDACSLIPHHLVLYCAAAVVFFALPRCFFCRCEPRKAAANLAKGLRTSRSGC